MMIPKTCEMNDLSHLDKLQGSFLLYLAFCKGDEAVGKNLSIFRRVYIRLCDKAVDEYQYAREMVLAQIKESLNPSEETKAYNHTSVEGRKIYMFKFVDHMENCLNAICRMLRLLKPIKSNPDGPNIPKDLRKLVETIQPNVTVLRNLFEHIENDIENNEFSDENNIMIRLDKDEKGVVIGCHCLSFVDLENLICNLNKIGAVFSQWRSQAQIVRIDA